MNTVRDEISKIGPLANVLSRSDQLGKCKLCICPQLQLLNDAAARRIPVPDLNSVLCGSNLLPLTDVWDPG
jgi:hypothetical protein